jgi:hypothetical protein
MKLNCDDATGATITHEAGHAGFASLCGVPLRGVTILGDANTLWSFSGAIRMLFDDFTRGVVFSAGCVIQKHYFPNEPVTSLKDREILNGFLFHVTENQQKICRDFIRQQMQDPIIRDRIEALSAELLLHKTLDEKQIREILKT